MRKKKEEEPTEQEAEKKFKLKLEIKSGVDGIDNYLQETSTHFIEFDIKLMRMLVESLHRQSESIIHNLFRITNSEDETIPTLDEVKAEDTFSKLKIIISNAKEVKQFCDESLAIIEDIDESITKIKESNKPPKIDNSKNIFEEIQKKKRQEKLD